MDPTSAATGKIFETLITFYGPPGLIIAVLMLTVWRLFNLYIAQVAKDHEQTLQTIESMNNLTAAVKDLKTIMLRGTNT